ncbi:uncharacterized protein LOC110849232 isoform X2 [Folsomia candida]|uniref:uncharacterized protein LOC110849232 isoform X2 n=1 Tax=Folsomia candida TaxID=158441 RepID=UPI001604B35C|nr:uncharacterized protein LOC110849232 isoform X2 [Folsomia candida]
MDSKLFIFLGLLLLQGVASQDEYEYEEGPDDEDESAAEVNVPVTTLKPKKKIDHLKNMTFSQEFQNLASEVDAAKNPNKTVSVVTTSKNGTTKVTFTTRRPRPRPTTELNRGQEIGSSVNGILSSVTNLDIPGIVDNALSIRNNEPVREFVTGLMTAIFCSPFLNNFSTCGGRLGTNNNSNRRRTKPKPAPVQETPAEVVPAPAVASAAR